MIKTSVLILGIVFIIIGLLGFFNSPMFGLFTVNALHNLIHLVTGILAVIFAVNSESAARKFSQWFGIIYAIVAILGFAVPSFMVKLVNTNAADNWLHVIFALIFLALGFMSKSMESSSTESAS
jgi:uncharacterized membrane protein HdeD (DUF308 family)